VDHECDRQTDGRTEPLLAIADLRTCAKNSTEQNLLDVLDEVRRLLAFTATSGYTPMLAV